MVAWGPFQLERPTARHAVLLLGATSVLAVALCFLADRVSPVQARANLPVGEGQLRTVFLTTLPQDPARVLMTTERDRSTWARDMTQQGGTAYWLHSYGDPARPGLPERLLLSSRSRGANLLVPLGALDLEQVTAIPAAERLPAELDEPHAPVVRRAIVELYLDRNFVGLFLELRFPERRPGPQEKPLDLDLVVVRGNQVRAPDFLLHPDGELYRSAIVEGVQPGGAFVHNPATGELVFLLHEDIAAPCEPLYVPIPLFDELGLMWGGRMPTLLDDRWNPALLPAFELAPAPPEVRSELAWSGTLHLLARLEDPAERERLRRALEHFAGS